MIRKIKNYLLYKKDKITYYRKKGVQIGNDCSFVSRVSFGSEPYLIKLGNKVRISSGVSFITHDGGMHVLRNILQNPNIDKFAPIIVKDNVFIGANVMILPGVTIEENVVIGAGSIVTKDLKKNSVYAGIPARYIKSIEKYLEDSKTSFEYTKNFPRQEKKKFLKDKYTI